MQAVQEALATLQRGQMVVVTDDEDRVTTHNLAYLTTKRDRMGHLITLPEDG
ncbi:hypothetical protein GCM10009555_062060 [Acrocarpospora macrocephala]|uniref:3,4-dihydroxy-2-butanone-4-phosphate synthase n=1 Tax=Acrocarpospora macrocephala TaxID=150177 RepID=A0A5M3WNA6_9ACTN|nr:hypothetical protein [Acrocarpospora macrocephala]GES09649.1 hypothetical protein Amac_032450 [Acrocarpospora macrocephala]